MSSLLRRFKFPFNRSLRQQIMSLIGGMLVFMLIVIGSSVAYFTYQAEVTAWRGRQSEAARHATQTVATFVSNVENLLTAVSAIEPVELGHAPKTLRAFLLQNPAVQELIRLDAAGRVLASASRDQPLLANLITIPQSEWFRQAQTGQAYLGSVQIAFDNAPYMIVATPVSDGGVVAARVQMDVLWEVIDRIHFGKTGRAYVINRLGLIIAHTNYEINLSSISVAGRPEFATRSPSTSDLWYGEYINFQSEPVVGTSSAVPNTDWVVITELSQQEAYATSQTAILWLTGGFLLFASVTALATRQLLNRWIIRPVDRLRAGVERVGQGDLSYRIELARRDELGQVATAFDHMAEQLQARTEQLRDLNAELEERVVQRTAELQRANLEQMALLAASQAISASLDLESVLNHLAVQMLRALDVTSSYICDWQPRFGTATLLAVAMSDAATPRERTAAAELGNIYHLIQDFGDDLESWLLPGQPLLTQVDDPNLYEPSRQHLLKYDGRSVLTVPIVFQGHSIGYADLWESRRPREFTAADIALAQAIAQQAAVAFENARLHRQVVQHAAELQQTNAQLLIEIDERGKIERAEHEQRLLAEALRNTAAALSGTLNYDEVLDRILISVGQIVPYQAANLMLLDTVGQTASIARHQGYVGREAGERIPALYFEIATVPNLRVMLETGESYVVPDTRTWPTWVEFPETRWIRSYLGTPLRSRGRVIGFLNLDSDQPCFYSAAHADQLKVFADQAALAVENAQLYATIHQHADELERRVAERTRELQTVNEQLATANVQLTELDQLKDEFVSRISHELRTPLTSVKIYLELLEHGKPEKRAKYMTILTEQTARLQKLIEDLLDISQLQPATTPVTLSPIKLTQIIHDVYTPWAKTAEEKEQLLLDQTTTELPLVSGDPTAITQALTKLLSNAVNYTPRGGQITIQADPRNIGDQAWVTVTVKDTGPGITHHDRAHIFERFYRGQAAADYKTPGAGLGLFIAQQLIRELGGRITVESESDQGSAFTLWLKPA